jgi:hypothetical protein
MENAVYAGRVAAFVQLASLFVIFGVMATLGSKPASVEEYFVLQQTSRLASLLRGDFYLLILFGAYLFTFPALYFALRGVSPVGALLATLFTIVAVTGFFLAEPSFSMLYLGDKYAQAVDAAQRAQIIAAGEAVMATDGWNSSGGYMGGILLQGAGVMISIIMLRSKDFSKVTAWAGLLGNGIDLVQHVLHPFAPAISAPLQQFMGLFYLVWFPMLGRDLLRLGRSDDPQRVTNPSVIVPQRNEAQ